MADIKVKLNVDSSQLSGALRDANARGGGGGAVYGAHSRWYPGMQSPALNANYGAVTTAGPSERWWPGKQPKYSESRGLPGTYSFWRAGQTDPRYQGVANQMRGAGINGAGVFSQLSSSQFGSFGGLLGAFGVAGGSGLSGLGSADKIRQGGMFKGISGFIGGKYGLDGTVTAEIATAITQSIQTTLKGAFRTASQNIGRGIGIGAGLLVGASVMGAEGQAAKYSLGRMAEYGTVSSPAQVQAGIAKAGSIAESLGIGYGKVGGNGPKRDVVDFLNAIALKTPATAYSAAAAARTLAIATGMDFQTALSAVPSILSAAAVTASSPEDAAMGLMTYSQTGQRRSLQAAVGLTPEQMAKFGFKRGATSTDTMRSLLDALNKAAVSDPRYKNALRSLQEEPQTKFSNLGDAFLRAVEPISRILSTSVVPVLGKLVGSLDAFANAVERSKVLQYAIGSAVTLWGANKLTGGLLKKAVGWGWELGGRDLASRGAGALGRGIGAGALGRGIGAGARAIGLPAVGGAIATGAKWVGTAIAGAGTAFLSIAAIVAVVLAVGGKMIASWWERKSEEIIRRNERPISMDELDAARASLGLRKSDYRPKGVTPRGTGAEMGSATTAGAIAGGAAEAAYGGVMP